ncbi:exodeoxyribonuclease I [Glaciecola sp. MH2013]|uniref:exodeoxyribonuclease I n=1 Tax=Glaciecola sp. MH2013 TaxID=2785524 RepID=UPI00189F9614|nr:exodeoxyribonuclease I [Glaciecola sp. MH2013]MBF7072938.1 exodeoxyribonuclease I [Glaciecola sp. MH2013]
MSTESLKDNFSSFLVDITAKNELPVKSDYVGPTLLFHDYESWGVNAKYDFPSQFAAIRTDLDLNIIEKPVSFYCQIPNDYIPNPMACLVTGITPQKTLKDGYNEIVFAQKINELMTRSDTCVVGYNSIRYDDEVTRNLFYRNFYDPYEREWKNGNSRWDIIDLVRACYALRPEGITWPKHENGLPSFRLEDLTKANDVLHENAHDAISDVKATIAMAKLIKEKQPKLYDFYFGLRNKNTVLNHIDIDAKLPFLHISGMLPSTQGCCSWFLPICQHPTNKNAIICIDLSQDASVLAELSSKQLNQLLYTAVAEMKPGQHRPPVKLVHINKCPFVAPAKTLTPEHAHRLGIDREHCLQQLKMVTGITGLAEKLSDMFIENERSNEGLDVDGALYSRAFPSSADKQWKAEVRTSVPEQLIVWQSKAPNDDYAEQLFRLRARNYPGTLEQHEFDRWQQHRKTRFTMNAKKQCLSVEECQQEMAELAERFADEPKKLAVLSAVARYLEEL